MSSLSVSRAKIAIAKQYLRRYNGLDIAPPGDEWRICYVHEDGKHSISPFIFRLKNIVEVYEYGTDDKKQIFVYCSYYHQRETLYLWLETSSHILTGIVSDEKRYLADYISTAREDGFAH